MSMHFISSLPKAKIYFNFQSSIVIWNSPSSAVPPQALALEIRKERRRMLEATWWSLPLTLLFLMISNREMQEMKQKSIFSSLRRVFLIQVDHIKGKAKIQTFLLFGDPPACSYIFLLFKKHVHHITCTTFQNILFSQQKGHVLTLMQPQLCWRDWTSTGIIICLHFIVLSNLTVCLCMSFI